jgi:RHS repeat-associated protein
MEYSLAGFNGQRPDPVSGHSHLGNGYRAYNPVLGCFTAPDSWSPFGIGGINPYAYCAGDPVNRADPSGHMSLSQGIGMALGIVAGIGFSMLTEGLALGPITSLLANMAGDALIGAGSELAANGIDGQRVNGSQVGIAAGEGALMGLLFNGAGVIGSKLRGTSNRPFGGLMSPAMQITEEEALKMGAVRGYNKNYEIHFLGFAAKGAVAPDAGRFSYAISDPSGIMKISIHGNPGVVSLAERYSGNKSNTLNAAGFVRKLNNSVPRWAESREIQLNICHSADGGEDSIMNGILNSAPRGVTVTGAHGVARAVYYINIRKGQELYEVAKYFDSIEQKMHPSQFNSYIAQQRPMIPSHSFDPFIYLDMESSGSDWVTETRL